VSELDRLAMSSDAARFVAALAGARHVGVCIADMSLPDQPLTWVSPGFETITGYAAADVLGRNCRFLQAQGMPQDVRDRMRAAIANREPFTATIINQRRDRTPFWNEVTLIPATCKADGRDLYVGVQTDVSAQMRISASGSGATRPQDASYGAMTWFAETGDTVASPAFMEILGLDPASFAANFGAVAALFPLNQHRTLLEAWREAGDGRSRHNIEVSMTMGGLIRYYRFDIKPVQRPEGGLERIVATVEESARGLANERRLRQLAYIDQLTGLYNRTAFFEHLETTVASGKDGVVALIDLDAFKEVNDTHGHDAGDLVLREIGSRLQRLLRAEDIAGRLGGDEFAVLLRRSIDDDAVETLCREIIAAMSEPIMLTRHKVGLGASIGYARFPDNGGGVDQLIKNADMALYTAKIESKGTAVAFADTLRRKIDDRRVMAENLRQAMKRRELTVHYQPQIRLRGQTIFGMEALVRWPLPDKTFISPGRFVPIAEEEGLIEELGAYVMETAVAQIRDWRAAGIEPGVISVNVAAAQIRERDFARNTLDLLKRYGVPSRLLKIELTENILVDRYGDVIVDNLHALAEAGVGAALDDFGTGWASLSHLRKFPIDCIKIDRSFVMYIEDGAGDMAICQAIVGLAHALGMTVVAEGVETETQRDLLLAMGCDVVQGYFFAKPMSTEVTGEWVAGHAAALASVQTLPLNQKAVDEAVDATRRRA
jgi:diguanylate cyclase (GGDEF)-like protein/PAS domain S-box-containing protein